MPYLRVIDDNNITKLQSALDDKWAESWQLSIISS